MGYARWRLAFLFKACRASPILQVKLAPLVALAMSAAPAEHLAAQMPKKAARAAGFGGPARPSAKPPPWQECQAHRSPQRPSPAMAGAFGVGARVSEASRCARGNPKAAAAGGNEDDEGDVRSEGSGPQSLSQAHPRPDAERALRTNIPPQDQQPIPGVTLHPQINIAAQE